jgi:hypothetical protein
VDNPEIFVDPCYFGREYHLRIRSDRLSINGEVVKRGVWMKEPVLVEVEDGAAPPVAVRLSDIEAQALMDRLWKAGLRPTEGSGSAGALAATQDHLKDMQKLVFETGDPRHTAREIMDAIRREERRGLDDDNSLYRKLMGNDD